MVSIILVKVVVKLTPIVLDKISDTAYCEYLDVAILILQAKKRVLISKN